MPDVELEQFKAANAKAALIQSRLASANFQRIEARDAKQQKAQRQQGRQTEHSPKPALAQLALHSGHNFTWSSGGLGCCSSCKQVVSLRSLRRWLQRNPRCRSEASGCLQPLAGKTGGHRHTPVDASDSGLTLGNTRIHATHRLICSSGFWWCDSCGAHAAAGSKPAVKSLAKICRREKGLEPTRYGAYALRKLRQGQPPARPEAP